MSKDVTVPPTNEGQAEDDHSQTRAKRWGCLQWTLALNIALVAIGLLIPARNAPQERARIMQASSNCRQILIALKSYAGDHHGAYPVGETANDAFRELFKAGLLEDERAFTAASSPYEADNNIGGMPNYEQALEPGENHWAMTRGLTDADSGNAPLVFENPAIVAWPPLWNCDASGQKKPGRAWKSGKIVVGRNDGAVSGEQLESVKGDAVPLKADASTGKDLFELAGPHEIMDVAR